MNTRPRPSPTRTAVPRHLSALAVGLGLAIGAMAADHGSTHSGPITDATPATETHNADSTQAVVDKIKATIAAHPASKGQVSVVVGETLPPKPASTAHAPTPSPTKSRDYIRARAAALSGHAAPEAQAPTGHAGHEAHWSYSGEYGPQNWAGVQPGYSTCATGQRQSPVHIEEGNTLQGPAEPLDFRYTPSGGSVVNNGHTIQVDLDGDNSLSVRGSTYKLVQFHFHHPAEEKINYKGFSMVAHLVHKNAEGQLAVVAVLIDPGAANPLVNKVWTHMPLDVNDRVRLPDGLLDMKELLPQDQRYYQFIGSLTTPPCTEGVLWMVLKQPMTVSRDQLRLFAQLFPMNARPTQALNGRIVREAQ